MTNVGETASRTVNSLEIPKFSFCRTYFREKEVILSAWGLLYQLCLFYPTLSCGKSVFLLTHLQNKVNKRVH